MAHGKFRIKGPTAHNCSVCFFASPPHTKMQFRSVVAALASVAAVQAQNTSNATNGTNGTSVSTGAAASNAVGAGVFGVAVAAGVAFLF